MVSVGVVAEMMQAVEEMCVQWLVWRFYQFTKRKGILRIVVHTDVSSIRACSKSSWEGFGL